MRVVWATLLMGIFLFGCFRADSLFYHPDHVVYQTPRQHKLAYEEVTFQSADKIFLSGWFVPSTTKALGTVIHFHGNAQNMTAHFSSVAWLPKNGFNLFVFDYRGYGASAGSPSKEGLYQDCLAAIAYVRQRADVNPQKIIVLGQSLGGANAITAIGRGKVGPLAGVVVDSAFASYPGVARDHAGSLASSVGSLVSNDFSPQDFIGNISPIPILIIHGTHDRVVPYHHGQMLYEHAKQPKELWTINGGRHTDAMTEYGAEILPLLHQCLVKWVQSPGTIPEEHPH